jgi:hypothetical protein
MKQRSTPTGHSLVNSMKVKQRESWLTPFDMSAYAAAYFVMRPSRCLLIITSFSTGNRLSCARKVMANPAVAPREGAVR